MAIQKPAALKVTTDLENKRRENSYEKSATSAPDIQQPGAPGDVGNGATTGHTQPQRSDLPPLRENEDSVAAGPRLPPKVPDVTDPAEGAEPSNPYAGT